MTPLPEEQKTQFREAVKEFRGTEAIEVNAEKLRQFLAATANIDMAPANRLRWLAIKLEHCEFVKGWPGLRSIYVAATEIDPTDHFVLHSWGLSGYEWTKDWMTPELLHSALNRAKTTRH